MTPYFWRIFYGPIRNHNFISSCAYQIQEHRAHQDQEHTPSKRDRSWSGIFRMWIVVPSWKWSLLKGVRSWTLLDALEVYYGSLYQIRKLRFNRLGSKETTWHVYEVMSHLTRVFSGPAKEVTAPLSILKPLVSL